MKSLFVLHFQVDIDFEREVNSPILKRDPKLNSPDNMNAKFSELTLQVMYGKQLGEFRS